MALRVWLPLNGNLNNYGLSDITVTNNGATVDNNGKIGKCYKSVNSNRFAIPTFSWMTLRPENSFSIALWEKGTATSSTTYIFACTAFELRKLNSSIYVGWGGAANEPARYDATINDTIWYHITFTWDGPSKTLKLYINGILRGTSNITRSVPTDISSTLYCSYSGTRYLNDLRIYDHCLSPKEVYELSKGLIVHYKLNNEPIEGTTNISNQKSIGGWDNSGKATRNYNDTSIPNIPESHGRTVSIAQDTDGNSAITFGGTISNVPSKTLTASVWFYMSGDITWAISPYIRSAKTDDNLGNLIYNETTSVSNWPKNTWIRLTKTITTNDEATTIYFCAYTSKAGCKFVFNGWLIEEKDHATPYTPSTRDSVVYDCSGYQNNGAITGEFSILQDSKRYNSSIKYLNSDTSIAIGNLSQLCPDGIFTFNIWFKKNTGEWSTKYWETILGGPSGFELETKISQSASYIHAYSWGGGSQSLPNNYSIPYTLDEWHMLTMVRTSSYSKFYLDGELKVTGSAGSIPSGNYFLGAWNTATQQNYRGFLSDFRIYATELSASDILSLYQTSASIDNQQNFYSYEIEDNSTEYSGGLINSGEIFDLTFRETNNGLNVLKDIGISLAHLQNVKGNTLAWNQLVNKNTSGGFQASGLTGSFNNGVWTYSGMPTRTAIAMLPRGSWGKVSAGHKYFLSAVGTTSSGNIRWVSYGGTNEILNKAVGIKRFDNNSNDLEPVIANLTIGTAFSASLSYLVIDLTLIYGAGNEPTTVEQFEADYEKWFGKPLAYEPYNAGELIPTKTTALKTTEFNQWDEEWEMGTFNMTTGEKINSTNRVRSKNVIKIFPSTSYHFVRINNDSDGAIENILWYDSNMNFIYREVYVNNKTKISPDNAAYLNFNYYGTTYNHDICINLSWSGTRNGEYEPYESHTLQLPITTLTGKLNGAGESVVVFPDGMKKAGSVQDEIYISGGKTYAVKRVGSVDLGSLDYIKDAQDRMIGQPYTTDGVYYSSQIKPIISCARFITDSSANTYRNVNDKAISFNSNKNVVVYDSSYTDAATFQSAMQGVMLYYELATPLVYELDTFALPATFCVNDYGTEEQISNTTSIPAELLISYDIKDKISLIGNETIYGDMIPIESGTYNYSYKYEVVGSNNLFLIGLEYYDTNRNLLSTANQVSSTGALSEKVTSGNVSIPANTKYVRYKIVNDANNNSTSNTSTIYFISLRLDTANPLLIYSTGESICNEFIELDQTSIHDSGITETNNIYEI